MVERFKPKLLTFCKGLASELAKTREDKAKAKDKAQKSLNLLIAQARLSALKSEAKKELLALADAARAQLTSAEWIDHISVDTLPLSSKEAIAKVYLKNWGVCASCRYTSGCKDPT